jgi:hypothetical protein
MYSRSLCLSRSCVLGASRLPRIMSIRRLPGCLVPRCPTGKSTHSCCLFEEHHHSQDRSQVQLMSRFDSPCSPSLLPPEHVKAVSHTGCFRTCQHVAGCVASSRTCKRCSSSDEHQSITEAPRRGPSSQRFHASLRQSEGLAPECHAVTTNLALRDILPSRAACSEDEGVRSDGGRLLGM